MTQPHRHTRTSHSVVAWLFVLYVLFVVYGSLVPLTYVDRPLVDAVQAFKNIPFLVLGIESRADWVANGVLYVPVGFLTAAWLTQTFKKTPRVFLFVMAAAFSMALAVSVEFTQLFFPPRTVSLNDIMAECIGSLIGLALAARFADWFQALLHSFLNDPQRLKLRLLEAYVVVYFAFALFPYDLLLSWAEIEGKYVSNSWGWLVAGNSQRFVLAAVQLLTEAALAAPFGFLLVRLLGGRVASYKKALFTGLLLGIVIEFAQFFIASGISQGISILSRTLGVCGGVALYKHRDHWTAAHIAFTLRRYTLPLGVVYLVALLEINGWRTSSWQGLAVAEKHLAQLSFIPGYYHYFTTEAKALFSLTIVCMSYVPAGVLAWAHQRSARLAMVFALLLASAMETGKLFLPLSHPDLTNLLLACAGSGFTVVLLRQFMTPQAMDCRVAGAPRNDETVAVIASEARQSIWLLVCLLATSLWVFNFPAFPWAVGLVLAACAVAVWLHPVWVFAIMPAALPVFDLAPWSGRFFLDEFDALLLVTLAAAFARVPALPRARVPRDAVFTSAAMLLALSFVVSTVLGMMPFQLPDANSFNNYYSPYNALRIFKGAAWAYLVYALARRFMATGVDVRRNFAWGMSIGLAGTVVVILWERVAFSGLWNFAGGYRVTGPFSAIHVGGAYIECFLAAATPFLMMLMLEKRYWLARLAGLLLLLATTYALMVTFSRNGYTAFAVAVVISLLAALRRTKRFFSSGVLLAALASAMLLVAVPIFKGEFSQARMATVQADLGVRQAHWDDALAIRDADWVTSVFGMGLGRYPETNFWRSAEGHRSGTYHLAAADGNTYLRLSSGDSIYLEQLVSVQPGQAYVLKLDVRASVPNATLTVPICEKWMLTSYNCIWHALPLGKEFGGWRSLEARFTAEELSISPWYSQRPIKLSLYYAVPNSTIDIDNVRLETAQGANLIRNGDFAKGLDHWFFSTDGHLQWHIKSLFYGVLFDQGWFGLVALLGFLGLALISAARNAYHGDTLSSAGLAALDSFLVVGLFDTLIDAPRFLLLLLLMAWFCRYPTQIFSNTIRKSAETNDLRVKPNLNKT